MAEEAPDTMDDVRQALGAAILEQRLQRDWTRKRLAREVQRAAELEGHLVGTTEQMVYRWETGRKAPSAGNLRLLNRVFRGGLDTWASGQESDVQRRNFLRGSAVAGLAVLTGAGTAREPWERLAAVLRRPAAVDKDTAADLERLTINLEHMESHIAPKALLGAVSGHLDNLARLLGEGLPTATHRHLCSLAAETAGVAGWLAWDLDRSVEAESYFRAALEAAAEGGDRALGAYLVGSAACQPAYKERPSARLRQLETSTFGFRRADATPAAQAWLLTLESEAHVLLGDGAAAVAALDDAERALEQGGDEASDRPRVTFFDEAYLIGERGMTLSRLGDTQPAREALEHALQALNPIMLKSRPRLMAALARTHAADGDLDEACRVASEALVIVEQLQVEPNLGAVLEFREEIERWSAAPAVRDLDERLAAV